MSSPDYQKQAQDCYSRVQVIILGSGASAAHGISGMSALAAHLVAHTDITGITTTDQSAWSQFCAVLRSGVDLENALHQVALSEELTRRVISATWRLINAEDLEIFLACVKHRTMLPLGRLLAHMFKTSLTTINIITTNYDRLAEYACEQEKIHHYTGFTHGFIRQLADPTELTSARKVNIWKVHGSVDWFRSPQDEIVALSNVDGVPETFDPQIVTPGTQKYHRTHLEPYRSIINNSDLALSAANSYLCIGYGFNDEHIQPKLMAKFLRQNVPVTIVTYALSAAAKRLILDANAPNYLAIERGATDDQSVVYSSIDKTPFTVDKNIWSLEGYLSLIL
jgi:hypothetical protein